MSTQIKSTRAQSKKKTENTTPKNEGQTKEIGAKQSGQRDRTRLLSSGSTTSHASAPFCRICHDDDVNEALISPCDCKGSLNYCHASCLRSWLTEKVHNLKEPSCEICKCAYEVRYERVGRRDCTPFRQFRRRGEFIHFVVMSFCTFVLAASIAYTCWGAFSSSELAINFRLSPLAELTYSVYFIIDALCILVIIVEFNVGVWPIIKKWWKSNLSVVVIDKNNVAICTETLRVVEEASSLLEEEGEAEEEEGDEEEGDEEEEDEEGGEEEEEQINEETAIPAVPANNEPERQESEIRAQRVPGWWVKLWTRRGQEMSEERELENVELGHGRVDESNENRTRHDDGDRIRTETTGMAAAATGNTTLSSSGPRENDGREPIS